MIFEPLKSKRSFEEIAAQIRKMVVEGTLAPGARLPSEKELAHQFEVGRQSVREALRLLESSGLIRVKKGNDGGIFVSAFNAKDMSASISNIFSLSNISGRDVTETRLELEKIVLVYAIERMTPDDIAALEASIDRAQEGLDRGEMPVEENLEFHLILARATRNDMFGILVESVLKVVGRLLAGLEPSFEQTARAVKDHRSILKCIKKKKVLESVELMGRHLMSMENRLPSSTGKRANVEQTKSTIPAIIKNEKRT